MSRPLLLALLPGVVLLIGVLAWQRPSPPGTAIEPVAASLNSSPSPQRQLLALPPQPSPQAVTQEKPLSLVRHCLALAEHDPRQAVLFALDSNLDDTDAALLENLAAQWATRDFEAAHDWAQQQEDREMRDAFLARIAFIGSQSDPATAAKIVASEMAPGPRQDEAAISVLHQWALRDVDTSAAWAAAFPDNLRKRAMAEIEGIRESRRAILENR
ncbi:MAG TPA: hypothetical protein VIM61_16050 [Chthoniobacterales bacterium]|jgi:hypothetical protein